VAVEAAIVLPMVILLIFGMVEFSLLLRDYVSLTAATRAGTRLASAEAAAGGCNTAVYGATCVSTSVPAAAQDAANAMQRALSGVPSTSVNYVLVYKANDKGYPGATGSTVMPTSCSGVSNCVMFTWNVAAQQYRYNSGAWDSRTINACVNDVAQDSVGIYVKATHTWLTGLFGQTIGLSDRSVNKFEPLPSDSCKPGQPNAHP
jgi:Flp pilus assembly protein TadG